MFSSLIVSSAFSCRSNIVRCQLQRIRHNLELQSSKSSSSSSPEEVTKEQQNEQDEVLLDNNKNSNDDPYFWKTARDKCWRPVVSDVERISYGKPAKKKRTGSRGVPHRLNQEERFLYDQGRKKGFLEVAGSSWRSQRREAPILNTYRSLCDARGKAYIVLHKGNTGESDDVVVDLSPLRMPSNFASTQSYLRSYETLLPYVDYFSGLFDEEEDGNDSIDEVSDDEASNEVVNDDDEEDDDWDTRPIYQLPQYCTRWQNLPRSMAKTLGKELSILFDAKDPKASKSLKPKGVKAGKGRRSGGYGIG